MKVLVVEAEEAVLKSTGVMLNKLGYHVAMAADCSEAGVPVIAAFDGMVLDLPEARPSGAQDGRPTDRHRTGPRFQP